MRVGILGTGSIASKMAETINKMDNVSLYAVASRTKECAEEFAQKYHVEKIFYNYEELAACPEVELVYIATPHVVHYENMKLCLKYRKAILCEKPFTVTWEQANEIFVLANEKGCFVAEAMWTRYMPWVNEIKKFLKPEKIGRISSLTANLGYVIQQIPRLREPQLAGGALLDLGIYLIHFARTVFGSRIKSITSEAVLSKKGVDICNSMILEFEAEQIAMLHSSICATLDQRAAIYGENGYVEIVNVNNPEMIKLYNRNHICQEQKKMPKQISGLEYELSCCCHAMERGELECLLLPHEETLEVLRLMEEMRKSWGMEY